MSGIVVLLSPLWLAWKNDFRRSGATGRRLLLAALGLALWLGIYVVVRRVLVYFQSIYDLGPALAYQLLLIILLTFFSMLLFSNLVTALSAFFLARDLDLIHSTPIPHRDFYYARLISTTINSSWMVLFFSLPIFVAYNEVFAGGWLFYAWVFLTLPLLLVVPAALGVLVVHLLVFLLPARRIRDLLLFIGLIGFVILYFLFRFSQPERLVQPESFGHFLDFLSAMETPSSPYLPSSWAAEVLAGPLFSRRAEQGFYYALLASYALFFPLAACWISGAVHLVGWSKAQVSRQGRREQPWLDRILVWALLPFPRVVATLMAKDAKAFLRDSTQWSQLFLLLALVIVYLYNFNVLPLDRSPIPSVTLKVLVAFANLALAGFVLSAVAMRFAFPALSLEGRAFWVVQTAPFRLRSLLWAKFWLVFAPLLVLGEILVLSSNLLLRVPSWMALLSLITVLFMTAGITAIGVGFGALYPNFGYDHAAEIPTGLGGAVCMMTSVAFIGLTVAIEAWPIYRFSAGTLGSGRAAGAPGFWLLAPSLALVTALTVAAVALPMRLGLKNLERLRG